MKIANKEQKAAYIVLPQNCSACLTYAAEELTSFFKKCMDVSLNTVSDAQNVDGVFFSLGNTQIAQKIDYAPDVSVLNDDGFYIKTLDEGVYIKAATDRGILFGVYEIVEKYLGVRFITADTTVLPKCNELYIEDGEICEIPAFRLRGYLASDLYEDLGSYKDKADKVFALRQRARHSFLFPSEKFGGGSKIWGRHNTHNFHYFVDEKKYNNPMDKENYHPEFFFCAKSDVNKDFQFVDAGDNDTTICLSNGISADGKLDTTMGVSVAQIVIEEMKKDILAHPDIEYFTFEQEDGNLCCQCEKCRQAEKKYKRSGLLIRFINAVGKELQDWSNKQLNGRKINLVTYAYSYTLDAPVVYTEKGIEPIDETVIPSDNVIIRMAVGRNGFYDYFNEKQGERTKKALKEWGIIGGRFFLWTYDAFFDRYLLYMPSVHTIKANVQGFKKFGCDYLMVQGAHNANGMWQDKMRAYLYHKAMWNINVDIETLTNEFLIHYFGEHSLPYLRAFMQEYHDFYGELSKKKSVCQTYGMKNREDYDKDVLLKTLKAIREAKKVNAEKVKDEKLRELYDKRLTQAEVNSLFPLVENYFYHFPDKTQEDYLATAKEFLTLCKHGDISQYAELLRLSDWEAAGYKFPY